MKAVPLRLAGAAEATVFRGDQELLSRAGTLSAAGAHLPIAIATSSGAVIGGHLCAGSLVRICAELLISPQAPAQVGQPPPSPGSSCGL
jgi:hypothetical protein